MKSYKITWIRKEYGECNIKAESESEAEEKAEIGEHGEVISTGFGGSAGWVISDVEENINKNIGGGDIMAYMEGITITAKLKQLESEGYSMSYLQGYLAGCYDNCESIGEEEFLHLDFWITDIAFII